MFRPQGLRDLQGDGCNYIHFVIFRAYGTKTYPELDASYCRALS